MGGCNLSCSWCDSAHTWDTARYDLSREVGYWPVAEVAETALACRPGLIVISGGEPLLQQNLASWTLLLDTLRGNEIGVETNGTHAPTESTLSRVSWVTVSPKLSHSGDPAWARINRDVLIQWGKYAHDYDIDFSFAVRDASDVETARGLVMLHELPPERVWIVPEGTTASTSIERLNDVSEAALSTGFNLSTRLSALATKG